MTGSVACGLLWKMPSRTLGEDLLGDKVKASISICVAGVLYSGVAAKSETKVLHPPHEA